MKPTLDQGRKLLELVSQSGRSAKWVQEQLFGSGAFTDLLAVDDLEGVHRESHRCFLGLPPLTPPLLEPFGTVTVPAIAERFVASEKFVVDTSKRARVKIGWLGSDFKCWFLGKTEEPVQEAILRCARLTRDAFDRDIREEIGTEFEETSLAQVYALMERQPNGEAGKLLTNGRANTFCVRDIPGVLRAVRVSWLAGHDGWRVDACLVLSPNWWSDGDCVFFRNS
ncbi:MAG: hypothetical protein HYY55_04350 [Candidatus Niyogibacteria bacterium]|nr:MAG: hypothetical protein HYY55_04350 [Candidatus Niyogibacteria bacterium]